MCIGKALRVVRMKYERKVKKTLEDKSGGGRKKEDPDEAEWLSRIGREECVFKKAKKKSCGQKGMGTGLCREGKLKESRNKPGVAQRVPGGLRSQI
jgi:hypothetical protein